MLSTEILQNGQTCVIFLHFPTQTEESQFFKRHGSVSDVTRIIVEALDNARSKGWNTAVIWVGPFPLAIVADKEGIQVS